MPNLQNNNKNNGKEEIEDDFLQAQDFFQKYLLDIENHKLDPEYKPNFIWLFKAAKKGNPRAIEILINHANNDEAICSYAFFLGKMYCEGEGVEQNYDLAFKYLEKNYKYHYNSASDNKAKKNHAVVFYLAKTIIKGKIKTSENPIDLLLNFACETPNSMLHKEAINLLEKIEFNVYERNIEITLAVIYTFCYQKYSDYQKAGKYLQDAISKPLSLNEETFLVGVFNKIFSYFLFSETFLQSFMNILRSNESISSEELAKIVSRLIKYSNQPVLAWLKNHLNLVEVMLRDQEILDKLKENTDWKNFIVKNRMGLKLGNSTYLFFFRPKTYEDIIKKYKSMKVFVSINEKTPLLSNSHVSIRLN